MTLMDKEEAKTEAARSILPYLAGETWGEKKVNYLSHRFTGFSVREAISFAGIHERTIRRWRKEDPDFVELEQSASSPNRAQTRKEILHLLFTRNYHLMLKLDYDVLMKVMGLAKDEDGFPVEPSRREMDYLNKARSHYGPQQVQAIENLINSNSNQSFDFGEFVLSIGKRTVEETVEVRVRE